jgi:predicted  nucleic acid-binding Zn-ribbon protein
MKSSIDEKDLNQISFRFSNLHSEFYQKSRKSVRDCKPYLETIWELAILCPLPYYDKKKKYPVNLSSFSMQDKKSNEFHQATQLIQSRQAEFINYNFRVFFDGIELKRYIQLPTEGGTIPKIYFLDFDDIVFDSRLKFSGYLFAQVPSAIKPLELNGVQIRLRGVGIGGYDSTFFKYYKQIETIRSRWVSGEIFIDEGLEPALNIDRDSFNEHDEHFKELQVFLHKKLDTVFDEINAIARERSDEKRSKKDEESKTYLEAIIAKELKGKFKLRRRNLLEVDDPIVVDTEKGEIILNTAVRSVKKQRADNIIRAVMLAYHTARRTTDLEEECNIKFYQLVKDIINELI